LDEQQADERLALAAREDPAAFAQLYQHYAQHVYRYLLTRVGSAHDAQDLTAQTFAAALKSIGGYRAEGSPAAWLTVIARNLVVSYYRRRRHELSLDDDALDAHIRPLTAPATEEIVGRRLRMASVLAALNRLPAERAEVIRLRIFAELSTAETAQAMGKSEAAVKMLLHRALGDLRRLLAGEENDE
jgi:RNA polymerase sigma-70 factor (ECF subfamily)